MPSSDRAQNVFVIHRIGLEKVKSFDRYVNARVPKRLVTYSIDSFDSPVIRLSNKKTFFKPACCKALNVLAHELSNAQNRGYGKVALFSFLFNDLELNFALRQFFTNLYISFYFTCMSYNSLTFQVC